MTNPVQISTVSTNTDSKTYSLPTNETNPEISGKSVDVKYQQQIQEKSEPIELNHANKEEVTKEALSTAVEKLNDFVTSNRKNLRFSIDEDTGRTVVKLVDSENNVLRQIPSEEVLHLIKSLEQNKGLILEDYA